MIGNGSARPGGKLKKFKVKSKGDLEDRLGEAYIAESTNAAIIAKIGDEWKGIWVKWDGYEVGDILSKHYRDQAQVKELLSFGNLRSLHNTLKDTQADSYHVSRSEPLRVNVAPTLEHLYKIMDEYYTFVYDGRCWNRAMGWNPVSYGVVLEPLMNDELEFDKEARGLLDQDKINESPRGLLAMIAVLAGAGGVKADSSGTPTAPFKAQIVKTTPDSPGDPKPNGTTVRPQAPFLTDISYTGSMRPTLKGGEVLSVVDVPFEDVEVGMIVVSDLIKSKNILPIHRVIAIRTLGGKRYLITQGDHNMHQDPWHITKDDYIGVAELPDNPAKPDKSSISAVNNALSRHGSRPLDVRPMDMVLGGRNTPVPGVDKPAANNKNKIASIESLAQDVVAEAIGDAVSVMGYRIS